MSFRTSASIRPDVLQRGMVVVFETILGQPGTGGAKIEDAVLVTEDAPERLSRLPIRTWPERTRDGTRAG